MTSISRAGGATRSALLLVIGREPGQVMVRDSARGTPATDSPHRPIVSEVDD